MVAEARKPFPSEAFSPPHLTYLPAGKAQGSESQGTSPNHQGLHKHLRNAFLYTDMRLTTLHASSKFAHQRNNHVPREVDL